MTKIVDLLVDGENQFPYTHFQAIEGLVDFCFPVGSVIDNQLEDFDPNETYPGSTWERYAQGKIPIGVDENDSDFDTAGKTGGTKSESLTAAQLASHGHTFSGTTGSAAVLAGNENGDVKFSQTSTAGWGIKNAVHSHSFSGTTANAGNGQPHNNMPPYIAVYMWVRVA